MKNDFELDDSGASCSTDTGNAYPAALTEKETAVLKKMKTILSANLEAGIRELAETSGRSDARRAGLFKPATHGSTIKSALRDLVRKLDPSLIETLSAIEEPLEFHTEFQKVVDERLLVDLASQVFRNTNSRATDEAIEKCAKEFGDVVKHGQCSTIVNVTITTGSCAYQ